MGHSRARGGSSRLLCLVRRVDLLHERGERSDDLWPADLHLIGKDILRFHAVYWPAFLMAADLPLPKQVFAHGWILHEDNKMSKSRGNVVRPGPIVDVVGADALRYFLLREITFGQDGSFSYDALIQRYNSDLANGLGNLASRTLTLIHQYRNGIIPDSPGAPEIAEAARRTTELTMDAFCDFNFSRGLETLWGFISVIDKFIVERAPWKLGKDTPRSLKSMLDETLYSAAEALRIVCAWVYPVMPNSARNIWIQLGMKTPIESITFADLHWGKLQAGQKIGSIAAVFPRLDASAIVKMENLEVQEKARQAELFGTAKGGRGSAANGAPKISDRRFRESGPARRPSGQRGAGERRRQASAHEGGHRRRAAADHCGGHRRIVSAGGDARTQSGDRRESAAAKTARNRIERHDRCRVARRRQAGAGRLSRRCAGGSSIEVSLHRLPLPSGQRGVQ